jgi:hypothetical protein
MKARILALEERNDEQVAGLKVVNVTYSTDHGFLSGFVSSPGGSAMMKYDANMGIGAKVAVSAAIGGTAEVLGVGKFANGAITGAFVGLFNHAMHQDRSNRITAEMRREIYYESYIEFREYMKSMGLELPDISESSVENFFNDLSEKTFLLPNESVAAKYGAQQDLEATISTVAANVMNNETGKFFFENPLSIGNPLQPESGTYFSYGHHFHRFPRIVVPINSKQSLEFRIQWKVDPHVL